MSILTQPVRRMTITGVLLSLCAAVGGAQTPTWTRVATTGPHLRDGAAMVYDSGRDRVVLFGGHYVDSTHRYLADTWEWDGTQWTLMATTGPSARANHAMAYDSARQRVVLYGGSYFADSTTYYRSDTWEWNGTAWSQIAVAGPGERSQHAMDFHVGRSRTFLFGGKSSTSSQSSDLWEFDGTGWIKLSSSGPLARLSSALVYDSGRNRMVLFGGNHYDTSWVNLDDTWGWGTFGGWTQRSPGTSPSARKEHAMAYDSARGVTVLYGGNNPNALGDTWEYDGTTWTEIAVTGPALQSNHSITYDSVRQKIVLFGLYGDTWVYGIPATPFVLSEAQQALRIAGGLTVSSGTQKARLNIATTGTSASRVDLSDVVLIMRKVRGLEPNP